MTRFQFAIALLVITVAGLLGGALSEQASGAPRAYAQRAAPAILEGQALRLVDANGDDWGELRIVRRGPRSADVELVKKRPGAMQIRTEGSANLIRLGDNRLEMKDASGNVIRMDRDGIAIESTSKLTMKARSSAGLTASRLQVNAPVTECSGVLKCDTLTTDSVVSKSYTPGAGNVW